MKEQTRNEAAADNSDVIKGVIGNITGDGERGGGADRAATLRRENYRENLLARCKDCARDRRIDERPGDIRRGIQLRGTQWRSVRNGRRLRPNNNCQWRRRDAAATRASAAARDEYKSQEYNGRDNLHLKSTSFHNLKAWLSEGVGKCRNE